jgi:hypothetical protein
MSAADVRLLLPETLWLEPEYCDRAREISQSLNHEPQQWQVYLNTLGILALESWLKECLPDHAIQLMMNVPEASYLRIGGFNFCVIATEHVLDETVRIPRAAIAQPELAAHFYVVLEVLEEEEQAIVRGFLRHDELTTQASRMNASASNVYCLLPLSVLDVEPNHLLTYIQYSEPNAIPLPAVSTQPVASSPGQLPALTTRLSQWLQGVLDEGWQAIDTLVNPEASLAWSTRQAPSSAKGGKLINFGIELGGQTVALLVTVVPEDGEKIGVNIQVLPASGAHVLPSQLRLTLLSRTDKMLQEVQSRTHDNLIQLKPFKGKPGTGFSIEVSLNDIRVRETFEL